MYPVDRVGHATRNRVDQNREQTGKTEGEAGAGSTAAESFDVLWAELVQVLGAPTTAALLRRSAKRRLGDHPDLNELAITRQGFEYVYAVPAGWKQGQQSATLQALLQELCSVLVEMTGPMVVGRLKTLPELAAFELPSLEDRVGGGPVL
jgi:hypothetical protein